MNNTGIYKLSQPTKNYLSCFYAIFDEMVCEMTDACLKNSISYNFIIQIIPHSLAAVQMSQNLLRYVKCGPLPKIAANIVASQTKYIEAMRSIKRKCLEVCSTCQDLDLYQRRMNQIMRNMFYEMASAKETNQIELNFTCEMIPHQTGGVRMAENVLRYNICPELTSILAASINSQRKSIHELECLLKSHCN